MIDKQSKPSKGLKAAISLRNQESEYAKRQLNREGVKHDSGKPDVDLVLSGFSKALIEVSKVGTFGAKKYVDNGWKKVHSGKRRYSSAMLRHYFLEEDEFLDDELRLPHAAAVAWNALARLEIILKERNEVRPNQPMEPSLSGRIGKPSMSNNRF